MLATMVWTTVGTTARDSAPPPIGVVSRDRRALGLKGAASRRLSIWLVVIPTVLVSVDAAAQGVLEQQALLAQAGGSTAGDAPTGSAEGAADGAPGTGATSVPEGLDGSDIEGTPTSPTEEYSRLSPFDFGAQSYSSGFSGCAARNFGIGRPIAGVRQEISLAPGPQADPGRFFQLSLGVSETYTDNLNLAPEGSEESDFITEIAPQLDACASRGRFRGSLSYQLQGLIYAENSEFNDINNNVAADTTIELLPGRLYLGADTSYTQTTIDPSLSFSRDNAIRPDNQTGAWISNITPVFFQALGPIGDATLRYRYGKAIYGDSDIPEATINSASFDLTSPEERDVLSWNVSAFTQEVRRSGGDAQSFFQDIDGSDPFFDESGEQFNPDNGFLETADDANTTRFDQATLELGYQLTPFLRLLALGGLENDFRPDGTTDRLGEEFWNAGFRWASATNTLEARVGRRFFGTSYFVRAAHRGRVLDASVDYREEPSTQGLNSLNSNAIGRSTSFQQPVTSLFDRGVFVQKQLSASIGLHSALTQTTLTAYSQKREFVEDVEDEEFLGGDLRFVYQFLPRMTLIPRAGWQRREGQSGVESDIVDFSVALARQFSPTAQGAVSYGHSQRFADGDVSDYEENRVIVQFSKGF